MNKNILPVLVLAISLPSCASIVDGTAQQIKVTTTPEGAECKLLRAYDESGQEKQIGQVNPTPGEVTIEKTKYDITVKCNKQGYLEGVTSLVSGNEGSTLGNIILGGGIGWAVDSARGADNKYPDFVNVPLALATTVTEIKEVVPVAPTQEVQPTTTIQVQPVTAK